MSEVSDIVAGVGQPYVDVLRQPLSGEQTVLLETIYRPFAATGEWPIWQYVDLSLDALGVNAESVIASLPTVRHPSDAMWSSRYALTWYMNPYMAPQPDQLIALTVAGMWHIEAARSFLVSFVAAVKHLVDVQRRLVPSPGQVVTASVNSEGLRDVVLSASIDQGGAAPADVVVRNLHSIFEHEPVLLGGLQPMNVETNSWVTQVPASIRELRDLVDINDYIDRIIAHVAPADPSPQAPSWTVGPLDLAYAIGYLDAVWRAELGHRLFVNLDAPSIALLTQPVNSESEFNTVLSALSDVLSRVAAPDRRTPARQGALESVSAAILPKLESASAERVKDAFATLISIRHLRVSTQHTDARHKAVSALSQLGVAFPIVNWGYAWTQVADCAIGALEQIRQEVRAGATRTL